jgi:hypothetical protein
MQPPIVQPEQPTVSAPPKGATMPLPQPGAPRIVYVDDPKKQSEISLEPPPRDNYLALSLFPLFRPFLPVLYERRIRSWLGIGGLAGLGSTEIGTSGRRFGVQVGPQIQVYPIGDFRHGMPIALEAVLMASSGTSSNSLYKVSSTSFNPAVTIGYKIETRSGFTLHTHLGLRLSTSRVTVRDASTQASQTATEFEPLFRLALGYSF